MKNYVETKYVLIDEQVYLAMLLMGTVLSKEKVLNPSTEQLDEAMDNPLFIERI